MHKPVTVIPVALGERSYNIHFGAGAVASLGRLCLRHHIPRRVLLLADTNSARAAMVPVLSVLRAAGFDPLPVTMPPGERQKSLRRAEIIQTIMLKARVTRTAAVIALGGGVVGDVAGFVASTYRRGLPLVQCPTTLLSQVDSSVGGKNGVNYPAAKNAIGTFHQPVFVLSDTNFLKTLPRREVVSGLGEILKYPLVDDPSLLDLIEEHLDDLLQRDPETVHTVAQRCLAIKTRLVSQDECELLAGRGRVLLNVAHAVGHALENLSHYTLRHGEAVFLGIIVEGLISVHRGWLNRTDLDRFIAIYHTLGCRFHTRAVPPSAVVRSLFGGGKTRFVLPRKLGQVEVVNDVTPAELTAALKVLQAL